MTWQPIETAPRNGTIVDVWLGDAEEEDIDFYCSPGTRRACDWSWRDGKWRPHIRGLSLTVFVQPTHWMPLPAPPEPGA